MKLLDIFKKKDKTKDKDIVSDWISEGKSLIYPEKYADWKKFVYRACDGKYFGLEVAGVLRIMKELETGKEMAEVINSILNDPVAKDYMRSDIRNRVFEFSKRGPEFLEWVLGPDNINASLREKIDEFRKENSILEQKYSNKDK